MIVGIEGKIDKKEQTRVLINCNGLIHEVFVSVNCSNSIKGDTAKLHTTHIIREDAWNLYGFLDMNEKVMFDTLIKINGIGPKVAMAICSTYSPATFAIITQDKDAKALERVPGIGAKTAGRIMVELAGFSLELAGGRESANTPQHEAMLALESLGFKNDIISKTLQGCISTNTADLVKEALKKLQGIK